MICSTRIQADIIDVAIDLLASVEGIGRGGALSAACSLLGYSAITANSLFNLEEFVCGSFDNCSTKEQRIERLQKLRNYIHKEEY